MKTIFVTAAMLFAMGCGDNDNAARPTPQSTATPVAATCPEGIDLQIDGGAVDIDLGATGIGYDVPLHDGIVLPLDAACDPNDAACRTCTLTASVAHANTRTRRRCADDVAVACDTSAECSSGLCVELLGPPLAVTTGGAASCARNEILSIGPGAYEPATGALRLPLTLRWTFYQGIDLGIPCPRCSGTSVGATSTCEGGPHDGAACIVDATDAIFGNTSYDCAPNPGALLGYFDLPMMLTTGSSSLSPSSLCTGEGLAGTHCYCPGQVIANLCHEGTCEVDAAGEGVCTAGPMDGLCRHERFRGCFDDRDCPADGDSCRHASRKCSSGATAAAGNLAPFARIGRADPATPILVSTFCVAAANAAATNQGLGLPGPAAIRMPVRVIAVSH